MFKNWEKEDDTLIEIDDVYFYISIPKNYDTELPLIENIPNGHSTDIAIDELAEFYKTDRIRRINNMELRDTPACSYCKFGCKKAYTCLHCNKIMCNLCYSEKTEEDAIKNGAQNWHVRKDELLKCFSYNNFLEVDYRIYVCCDSCGISSTDYLETHPEGSIWNTNDEEDYCPSCKSEREGFRPLHINKKRFQYGIGSIVDWIPILIDEETQACVNYNINKDSPFYHKVILVSVDDHGREGWNLWPFSLEKTIEQIREKVPEYNKILEKNGKNSWETHYSCPIHLLIESIGHDLYLG